MTGDSFIPPVGQIHSEEAGVAALTELLKAYPQIKSEEELEEDESSSPEDLRMEAEATPIDLSTWIIPAPDARPEPPAARPDEAARPTAPRVVEADSPRVMGVPKTAVQASLFPAEPEQANDLIRQRS